MEVPGTPPRRRVLVVLVVLALVASTSCIHSGRQSGTNAAALPGTRRYELEVGTLARSLLLHVPPRRPRRLGRPAAYPLVIVLHGSGADGETVRRMSGMDSIADAARFLVAYPDGVTGALGLKSDWNAGECCGVAASRQVDDVGFLREIVSDVAARLPVDRRRIYVAGFSDGARLAYHAACALAGQIAAIAAVAGSLTDAHCAPVRPVPLVAFHGTADHDIPYLAPSASAPVRAPPAAAADLPPSLQYWASRNRCDGTTTTRRSPHVMLTRFRRCAADVSLYTVVGGLHAWPGGVADGDDPTRELSASAALWRFFARHPLP